MMYVLYHFLAVLIRKFLCSIMLQKKGGDAMTRMQCSYCGRPHDANRCHTMRHIPDRIKHIPHLKVVVDNLYEQVHQGLEEEIAERGEDYKVTEQEVQIGIEMLAHKMIRGLGKTGGQQNRKQKQKMRKQSQRTNRRRKKKKKKKKKK